MEWPESQQASKNIVDFIYLPRTARVLIAVLKEEWLYCPDMDLLNFLTFPLGGLLF